MAFAYGFDRWQGASVMMFRNVELICRENFTPQQAYVKHSEILCSSATLMDREAEDDFNL